MSKKRAGLAVASLEPTAPCPSDRLLQVFTPREKRLLFGLVFRDVELDLVDFSNANLRETAFLCSSLTGADFSGADLREASFIGCDLRDARFDQSIIGHTRFDGSWLVGARGISPLTLEYVRTHGGLLWFS